MAVDAERTQTRAHSPARGRSGHPKRHLTAYELANFRRMLQEKRRELLGDIDGMQDEIDGRGPGQTLDGASNDLEDPENRLDLETTYGFIQAETGLLRDIEDALQRMEDGTYGLCVGTGQPIGRRRLKACPWTKYSIEYARALERGHPPFVVDKGPLPDAREGEVEIDDDEFLEDLVDLDRQIGRRAGRAIRKWFLETEDG